MVQQDNDFQRNLGIEGAANANPKIPSATKHDCKAVHRCKERQPDTTMATTLANYQGSSVRSRKCVKDSPNPTNSVLSVNSLTNINAILRRAHIHTRPLMFRLYSIYPTTLQDHRSPPAHTLSITPTLPHCSAKTELTHPSPQHPQDPVVPRRI